MTAICPYAICGSCQPYVAINIFMLKRMIAAPLVNRLIVSRSKEVPFWPPKRGVLQSETVHFAEQYMPYRKAERHLRETEADRVFF